MEGGAEVKIDEDIVDGALNFSQSFIIGRKNGLQGSGSLSPHGVLKTNGFSIFRQIEPFGFKNCGSLKHSNVENNFYKKHL